MKLTELEKKIIISSIQDKLDQNTPITKLEKNHYKIATRILDKINKVKGEKLK